MWIEITVPVEEALTVLSRPVRALWIEITVPVEEALTVLSRPVRALWIEILVDLKLKKDTFVEAREGLVD